MKIAIISDSHDNVPNIDKMLAYVKKENIEIILHCGDVCAPSVLKYLADNFEGEIYLVFGNVDGDQQKMKDLAKVLPRLHLLGEQGEVIIEGLDKKIGIVHYPEIARKMMQTGDFDLIFYGHNHRAWEETLGRTKLINPGTLAGLFSLATFAIYDFTRDKAELKILHQLA
jgi:uncharacterized protein